MAKEKKTNHQETKSKFITLEAKNAILGILIFVISLIGLADASGPVGRVIRYVFVYLFGIYSTFILLFIMFIGLYAFIKRKFLKFKINLITFALLSLLIFSSILGSKNAYSLDSINAHYSSLFNTIYDKSYLVILSSEIAGGYVGYFLYALFFRFFGEIATQVFCIVFIIGSLTILLRPLFFIIGDKIINVSSSKVQELKKMKNDREEYPLVYEMGEERLIKEKEEVKEKEFKYNGYDLFKDDNLFDGKKKSYTNNFDIFKDELFINQDANKEKVNDNIILKEDDFFKEEVFTYPKEESDFQEEEREEIDTNENNIIRNENVSNNINETLTDNYFSFFNPQESENIFKREEKKEEKKVEVKVLPRFKDSEKQAEYLKVEDHFANYQFPTFEIFDEPDGMVDMSANKRNAEEKALILNKKLESLNIRARVASYRISASFTRFEIALDPNSKVSAFNNIAQDLQLALAVNSIKMLVPIPGSSFIGVEVPNVEKTKVCFKQIISRENLFNYPPLQVFIGCDVINQIITFNLAKTPHLLIAGSTGSGKSVCVNTIILSLLIHNSPKDLKLILIDPKRVELMPYANIPHLAAPVITDASKAAVCLQKLVEFMNERYKLLEEVACKNIVAYNNLMQKLGKEKMPYYVCVIDELAELMLNCKTAETSIKEITQLSRAVGIHMIIATQRPSVDVVTGTIKNNIPSRIAFKVTSSADSRTILDTSGADSLLGAGDMLVNVVGSYELTRGQCAFIEDEVELPRVLDFFKRQCSPVYNPKFLDLEPARATVDFDNESSQEDELIKDIIAYMALGNQLSTTKIQTRFNIGYPRAARLIDKMSERGIIYRDSQTKLWTLNSVDAYDE